MGCTYRESVANVDDESLGIRGNGVPFLVDENLEAMDMILMKDGQGSWVAVRPSSKSLIWGLAWWVVV